MNCWNLYCATIKHKLYPFSSLIKLLLITCDLRNSLDYLTYVPVIVIKCFSLWSLHLKNKNLSYCCLLIWIFFVISFFLSLVQSLYIMHGNEYLRALLTAGILTSQSGPSWLESPRRHVWTGAFFNKARTSVSRSSVKHNCSRLSADFLGGRGRKSNRLTVGDLPLSVITGYSFLTWFDCVDLLGSIYC